jgi:uncharacterized protein
MLSRMLSDADLIPADLADARRWALAAAVNGVAAAMTRLGMFYHNATGVARDPAEAVLWWRRGAEGGDPDGQAMLGAAYHLGVGVEPDRIAALAWLLRGRDGGSLLATPFIPAARAAATPTEIAEAESRALETLSPPAEAAS